MTFVVWGGLHGAWLACHRWWTARRAPRLPPERGASRVVSVAATFFLVSAVFVFFRARSLYQAAGFLGGLVTLRNGFFDGDAVIMVLLAGLAALIVDMLQRRLGEDAFFVGWQPVRRGVLVGAMLTAVVVFSGATPVPFIYFQF